MSDVVRVHVSEGRTCVVPVVRVCEVLRVHVSERQTWVVPS